MKNKLLYFFIFFIIIALILVFSLRIYKNKEQNDNLIKVDNEFIVRKVHYYSSANAISNTTNYQNPEWNLRVYQYTDIAIYLDRINEANLENYITNLAISNIKTNSEQTDLYYLNPINFGNSSLNVDDILEEDSVLEYNVINSSNSENEQTYNIPIYFQDCSNPITLRLVNNLADNYKVSKDNTLTYNGGLIRELGLNLENINTKFNFDLEITTKNGSKRRKNIELNIPLKNDTNSILDGDFEIEVSQDIQF